ncbi:MAG: dipicolinate synthase subunit B [Clostridiales bacterium]|nr:dipicolinate synthase subunit B [Clostridiales bacterium]
MKIGYALCGSFCTLDKSIKEMEQLVANGHEVQPIMSETVYSTDTRFGKACEINDRVEYLTGKQIIHTIKDAEPLGPKVKLDLLIIAPCTGNTLAKMANGITDTAVTMAAKAHLRSNRPLVISLASNDAMSANLANISCMLNRKNVYFVPLVQDDLVGKPHSLVADFSLLGEAVKAALEDKQLRPLFK